MLFLTFFSVFVSCVFVESKTKLEDIVPVCNINDVHVDDCLRISSQNILPALAKGIKDWNLIGLDPIVVPSIVIGQDSGPISLRWENMNATIRGYSNLNFSGATVTKKGDTYNFALNFTTDKFSMSGDYKARGKMLFFPISNEGYEEIHSGSATLRVKFTAVPEKRLKKEYLKIVKFNLGFDFSSDINVVLKSNNKKPTQLDKLLSNFLNSNTKEIVAEMKPTFEAAFGALIKSYIQKFLEKVPLKDLFKN